MNANGSLAPSPGILLRRKVDSLALAQRIETLTLHAARVKKQLLAGIGSDKAEPSVADDLFDGTLHDPVRFPP
jgi:hypothetical protein